MSARKIRNAWWVDFRVEGVRHRKRSPDNTQAGAKAYESLVRQRLARGEPLDGRPDARTASPRFAEFAAEWLESYAKANNKPSYYETCRRRVRAALLPWFGGQRLDEIGAADVDRFKVTQTARGLAPATVNGSLVILRKLLQTAVDWGRLGAVPKVKKLREPPPPFAFLSDEECARLLSDQSDARCHAMVLLALRTGLRIGEMRALGWSDIDFARRIVTVRRTAWHDQLVAPKNGKARHVAMASDLAEVLAPRRQKEGLVFPSQGGSPWNENAARGALHRLCQRTGVRRIGWHALRHTFCSMLVMRGVPLTVVQALLGHADLRMTLRYSHLAPSAMQDAVQMLVPAFIGEVGQPVGNTAPVRPTAPAPEPVGIRATTLNVDRHPVAVAA